MENSLRAGQWVLFGWKFTEQHLASWLNSLRLGEPQEKRAVSHPLIPSEPMPASLFQTWSHWSQTQGSFGMSSFLCKGLYPGGLGWVGGLAPLQSLLSEDRMWRSMPGSWEWTLSHQQEVFLFLYRASVTASPFASGTQTRALCQSHRDSARTNAFPSHLLTSSKCALWWSCSLFRLLSGPPLPHPPSYSRSNKDQLWFWELLKNSKTNTFFSLLSQTVSCSPELESHVYNASNLCARFCTETPLGLVLQATFEPVLWHSPPWCPVPEETVLSFLDWRQFSFAGNSDFRTYLLRKKFPVLDLEKGKNHSSPWPSPDGHKVFH